MDIMIIGADRVGRRLAEQLVDLGEDIIVVDADAEKLSQLEHLNCTKIQGVALEPDVLEKAGIKDVNAVICASDNENMNVMVGQMILTLYQVDKVIVRIEYSSNENLYQAMGLQTVCSTSMVIESFLQNLGFTPSRDVTSVLGYPVVYDLREVTESWDGVSVDELERKLRAHVLAVEDGDSLALVTRDYRLHKNQNIVLVSLTQD